jgi:dTDP-glucose pyrophosphorylase/predicted transcriptional regulator
MIDWKSVLLRPDHTIRDAIDVLNTESLRVVLVSDEKIKLLGTVTDGDIRRALTDHKSMDTVLSDIMFRNPTTALVTDNRADILGVMKTKGILQVPIVDNGNKIVGLETLHNILESKKYLNPVFLMAGGFGMRLQPLTNDTPKPLLKINNKPILETIINQFIEAGFHNFYISTHYKADMVRKHFGDGKKWNVNITYIHEDNPLGTAGALGLLPSDLPDLPIIMMNGDILTSVDFESLLKFHNEQDSIATMCVREYDVQVPYGVVKLSQQKLESITEKPIQKFFINAGIYVLSSSILDCVDGKSHIDMPHLLEKKIKGNKKVSVFPLHEYWIDIGQLDHLKQAKIDSKSFSK